MVCAKFAHTTIHGAMKGKAQVQEVSAVALALVAMTIPRPNRMGRNDAQRQHGQEFPKFR